MTTRSVFPSVPPFALILVATLAWSCLAPDQAAAQNSAVSDAYQASNDLEAAGKYREAADALASLPPGAKETYVYHLRRAWLLYLAADHRASIAAYRDAIDAAPQAVEPRLGLMLPQTALSLWLDTVSTAEGALAIDPNNYLVLSRKAYAQYMLGRYAEAADAYRAVLALYPSDVEMRSGLGWSLLKAGRGDAAAEFRQVLDLAPEYVTAKTGLEVATGEGE